MSFLTVIAFISLLLAAEPQQPDYQTGRTNENQICYIHMESSGLIKIGQKHGGDQAQWKERQCVFRTDVIKDAWDYALIIFTIVFSGGLVWIGYRQIVWMRRTKEVNESAAAAAQQSTEIANRQTAMMFNDERAWIVVKPKDPMPWPLPPEIKFEFPLLLEIP